VGVAYVIVWGRHEDGYFDGIVRRISNVLKPDRIFGDGLLYVYNYTSSISPISGIGPNVKVTFDDGTSSESQTMFNYFVKSEVTYDIVLDQHSSYNITNFPMYWTFDRLTVNYKEARFDESSNVNTFIYVSGLAPDDTLDVFWKANEYYAQAKWKEDSFKLGWEAHPLYTGTISPDIASDGNTLRLSWNFSAMPAGEYQYYYYTKNVSVSTNDHTYALMKWNSTGHIAYAGVSYVGSESDADALIPFGSEGSDHTLTIVQLRPNAQVAYFTVGITNLPNRDVEDLQYLFVDYILIADS
jgi:hypothetical protein